MADQLSNDLASLSIKRDDAPPSSVKSWILIGVVILVLAVLLISPRVPSLTSSVKACAKA